MSTKRLAERDDEVAEKSTAFVIDKPIHDLVLLDERIAEEHGWRKNAGVMAEGNVAEASSKNPVTIWVLRSDDSDTNAIKKAITSAQAEKPAPDPLAELRAKADSGEDFTSEEIQTALRTLLLRST